MKPPDSSHTPDSRPPTAQARRSAGGQARSASSAEPSRLSWPTGCQPVGSLADRRDALSSLTGWKPVLQAISAKRTVLGALSVCRVVPRPLPLLPVLAILLISSLFAQSTSLPAPQPPPAKGDPASPSPKEAAPPNIVPSRMVDEPELDAYLESLSAMLSLSLIHI